MVPLGFPLVLVGASLGGQKGLSQMGSLRAFPSGISKWGRGIVGPLYQCHLTLYFPTHLQVFLVRERSHAYEGRDTS